MWHHSWRTRRSLCCSDESVKRRNVSESENEKKLRLRESILKQVRSQTFLAVQLDEQQLPRSLKPRMQMNLLVEIYEK